MTDSSLTVDIKLQKLLDYFGPINPVRLLVLPTRYSRRPHLKHFVSRRSKQTFPSLIKASFGLGIKNVVKLLGSCEYSVFVTNIPNNLQLSSVAESGVSSLSDLDCLSYLGENYSVMEANRRTCRIGTVDDALFVSFDRCFF
ncbi:hypothetical protein T265_08316 [Opisthorchis viverrini]|uniref:Uncharacterized protein n=1 Tax=Opisthorchis viverrini TaxID=6198 RepID=A0A074Z9V3_OPIVI|nr:hypothetical protein T265_08316 [Opisthorchis viverrini]KER23898.1 hypothetical protein T265_08316 [Opisthorchis viverrini]